LRTYKKNLITDSNRLPMQLKGMVKFFTAALILFSVWRLSFTFIGHNVETKIKAQTEKFVATNSPNAKGEDRDALYDLAYQNITDSLRDEVVFNFLGYKKTYQEIKEKELQLGLDLQGGMSVTLEVGLDGLVSSMSNNPKDPGLKAAIAEAVKMKANSDADFVKLFGDAYQKANPNGRLAPLFTKASQPKITRASSNEEVLIFIRKQAKEATQSTFNVLSKRIDKFGLAQPSINLDENKGIITVELAGVKNPETVRQYLQATAKLQFWEVANNMEMAPYLNKANDVLKNYLKGESPAVLNIDTASLVSNDTTAAAKDTTSLAAATATKTDTGSLSSLVGKGDSAGKSSIDGAGAKQEDQLFSIMMPTVSQSGQFVDANIVGTVARKDAAKLMGYFKLDVMKNQFPSNIKFLLGEHPSRKEYERNGGKSPLAVYAVKTVNGSDVAKLEGDKVKSAKFDYQQNGRAEIQLEMNPQGAIIWSRLTEANKGRSIAIALDDYVYSAPNVIDKISGGTSSITGDFSAKEGTDLANILQTGKLDAPATIVQEQVVGPTLGQESIDGGMASFAVAFLVIFILMVVYYSTGGIVANIALLLNLLFTFGVLANLGATLTMAGIAGIVLGIGMAVDTNVLIFERIKEELAHGDSYEDAVSKGYKRSYAPVLDGHITSLITAVVLYVFGLGPIKGFATTQIIALLLSLFTGILVSRLITDVYMKRGRHFNYFTKLSRSVFQKAKFHFIEKRKTFYVLSSIMILTGVASLFHGFDYGVEFDGGRSYTVKFDQPHKVSDVREKLSSHLEKHPVVKTIGVSDQLNITTDYMIDKPGKEVEQVVLAKLYDGLKAEKFIPANVDLATFASKYVQSTQTVLPTISKDLKAGAIYATVIAVLAIFIYIFIRFRKWQYSVGTIVSIVHDVAITLAIFSFFKDIVPFALEIDQHFIAAILTVIGFSMNDTVIVFDRVREYFRKTPNGDKKEIVNRAINDTLSRTIMTSLTVFLTAVILFIFGGEALRGFAFAMAIGVLAGTYSSIFVAAPILVDLDKSDSLRIEEDKEERIKLLKEQA